MLSAVHDGGDEMADNTYWRSPDLGTPRDCGCTGR